MSFRTDEDYPKNLDGVVDLGLRHFARPFGNEGFLWWHDCPAVSHIAWGWFGRLPSSPNRDVEESGHRISCDDPLTVVGSLLCVRCSDHGFIREGHWIPA